MIKWIFVLVVVVVLSYLADVGILGFLDLRVPFLHASLMSIILMFCTLGLLGRVLYLSKKGEKEGLREKIKELEEEVEELRQQ